MKLNARNISVLQIVLSLVLLVGLNQLAGTSFFRLDLTEDQRYSLKDATIDLLKDDERYSDKIYVQVYLEGDFPAEWKKLRREIEIKLEEFRAYAGNRFEYEFIDPFANPDEEVRNALLEELREKGVAPMSIPVPGEGEMGIKTIVPGAVIKYPGHEDVAVNFFPPGQIIVNASRDYIRNKVQKAITDLEYNLVSGVRRAIQADKPLITILRGHGELEERELESVIPYMQEYYDVAFSDLFVDDTTGGVREDVHALDNTDLLVVARPMLPFTEKEKYLVDQFVMRGGKVIWMVDGINAYRDSLSVYGRTLGLSLDVNLTDQLFQYGVRINNNVLLDEFVAPIGIPMQDGRLMIFPWYFYPMTGNRGDHPITNNLDPVKMEYVSSIDTLAYRKGIRKTVLLESSERSIYHNPPARIFYDWVLGEAKPNFNEAKPFQPVAVLLEGEFESLYKNRLTPEFSSKMGSQYREQSKKTRMLVIGDGDLIRNDLDSVTSPGYYRAVPIDRTYYAIFEQQLQGLHFGNRDFFLNALDYLLGDESLIASRTRVTVRMLDMEKVKDAKGTWQLINISVPVILIILAGIGQFWLRRSRYALRR
jgi:gliding-associated putative ABC transporter substrate-binding component GldG